MKRALHFKRVLRTALLVLLLSVVGKGYAIYDFSAVCSTGQTLYYKIIDATNHYVELSCPGPADFYSCWEGFSKPTGDIVLPENVHTNGVNYTVTSIGDYAFYDCNSLTGDLYIPNLVTSIGAYAFDGCEGFSCSLTIGNSVTSIGDYAFCGCYQLTGDLTIPNSVTSIGNGAFSGCWGFKGSLTIGNFVSSIGDYAFYECGGLTGNLIIPNSVTTIGRSSFSCCWNLTGDLTIPNSVTTIGDWAFYYCSGFNGNLTIPNSVTTIGDFAFFYCTGLTGNLTIPNSVTTIGAAAFGMCSGFDGSLIIPNSVTTIGAAAFGMCSGFDGSLIIPNSVTTIGNNPFSGCTGLEQIDVASGNTVYDSRNNCNAIIETEMNTLIAGCKSTVIPNTVSRLGYSAFACCYSLTSITIPNSVSEVSDNAFYDCNSLDTVICQGITPPVIADSTVFFNAPCSMLIVPCECAANYEATDWNVYFQEIIEDCDGALQDVDEFVSVFPNPTKDVVKVEVEGMRSVSVYNLTGQQIFNAEVTDSEFELDFSGHEPGIYLVRIETELGIATKQVVLTK